MHRFDRVLDVDSLPSLATAQINCMSRSLARLLLLTGIAGRERSLTESEKCSSVSGTYRTCERAERGCMTLTRASNGKGHGHPQHWSFSKSKENSQLLAQRTNTLVSPLPTPAHRPPHFTAVCSQTEAAMSTSFLIAARLAPL